MTRLGLMLLPLTLVSFVTLPVFAEDSKGKTKVERPPKKVEQRHDPGAPWGLKTKGKPPCARVVHPSSKSSEEWQRYPASLLGYYIDQFRALQLEWMRVPLSDPKEKHKAVRRVWRCVRLAQAQMREAEKLAVSACERDHDPVGCRQYTTVAVSQAEQMLNEQGVGTAAVLEKTTIQMVGRP